MVQDTAISWSVYLHTCILSIFIKHIFKTAQNSSSFILQTAPSTHPVFREIFSVLHSSSVTYSLTVRLLFEGLRNGPETSIFICFISTVHFICNLFTITQINIELASAHPCNIQKDCLQVSASRRIFVYQLVLYIRKILRSLYKSDLLYISSLVSLSI